MNILVPTDFSEMANTALNYAAMISKKMDATIILFHAVPHLTVWWALTNDELMREAEEKQASVKALLVKEGVDEKKIDMKIFYQYPLNKWINDFIRHHKIDLAVIGTKGTTGLNNVMMGSFAMGMIEHVVIPVIAVPSNAKVANISNILYPTDLEDTLSEINQLIPLAKTFDAGIHIIHISKTEIYEKLKAMQALQDIAKQAGYEKITTDVKTGNDIKVLIEESVTEKGADLLAMFPEGKGFFKQLFKGSVTEELSRQMTIPLLAIKKS